MTMGYRRTTPQEVEGCFKWVVGIAFGLIIGFGLLGFTLDSVAR